MYLQVKNVSKSYENGQRVQVLKGITTSLDKGQMCVICGPSGSGKSTFLNTVGALDPVDSGVITVDGEQITGKSPGQLSLFRRRTWAGLHKQAARRWWKNCMPGRTATQWEIGFPSRAKCSPYQAPAPPPTTILPFKTSPTWRRTNTGSARPL